MTEVLYETRESEKKYLLRASDKLATGRYKRSLLYAN
jgi:hypothetical protein